MIKKGKILLRIVTSQLYTTFREQKYLILLTAILLLVYWKWWMSGVRVATDFPAVSLPDLKNQLNFPSAWFSRGSIGMGGYSVFTLWSWPMDFIAGVLSNLGFNFEILERIMFIVPTLFFGVYSIWTLLKDLGLSKVSRFVASLFYLCNTYILLLIDGGQLGIGLAYAWFPTSYFLFIKGIDDGLRKKIIAGIGLWILGLFDIRFVYILGILLTVRFIFFGWTWEWVKTTLISIIVFMALSMYWILPLTKFPLSNTLFSGLTQTSNLDFTQLKNSVSLLQPHWYENIFGKIPPFRKEFLPIPVIVFLGLVLNIKKKEVWFWSFIALISVFLTKGTNPPLPNLYSWLFTHVPGFSLFRDSTKFFFLVALSYSVLIAFTVEEVIKRLPKIKIIFPLSIILYLLFLIRPVYLDQMTGTFSEPRYKNEYSMLSKMLEDDRGFGKILWIPSRPPLGYASQFHSSLEASRLESLRPFAISTVGNYETQNFIREGNYMDELFDIIGIKYIVYPYLDPKRDDMSKEKVDYYNTFLDQISNLPWVNKKISDTPVPIFETKTNQDRFFLADNTYFVVGSDKIYQDIKNLEGNFSDNSLIFSEETPGLINKVNNVNEAKIILFDKTKEDLTASFFDPNKFIYPAGNLDFSPNQSGWWKRGSGDLLWWRDFIQQKYGIDNLDFDYGGGWAVGEGDKQFTIYNLQFTKGKELFVRVMKSSKGGNVEFWQGNSKIGEIDTKIVNPEKVNIKLTGHSQIPDKLFTYDKAEFEWVKVGSLISNREITIKTQGQINVINSLVVVDQQKLSELEANVDSLYKDKRVLEWSKLNTLDKAKLLETKSDASVSYKELSPTHYQINIKGLKSPTTLVFSDTYNNLWKLNNKNSYPLFSIINGFYVENDGVYDLYFIPQKYIVPGLILSGTTLLISTLVLFSHSWWFIFRKKQA